MNVYLDIIISIIFGGTSGGLVYHLSKTYFTEKIKAGIKSEYDNKLENIRGDINRNQTILNTVLSSQNQTFQVGQVERINAIKKLWTNYLIIRNSLEEISLIDSTLFESEFNTLYTNDWKGNDVVEETLKNISWKNLEGLSNAQDAIEIIRPFLNEQIWFNIITLRVFSGRLLHLYRKGSQERFIQHWKNDPALWQWVENSLTEEEQTTILNAKISSIKIFQNFIEQKILNEIHNIITGQIAADNTYKRALQLTELIKSDK